MTDWQRLAEPFPESEVKQRPGAAKYGHDCPGKTCRETRNPDAHHQFSYVDARVVAQRLDDVVTPEGWTFTCSVIPGSDIVKGRLEIGSVVREDHGYPNSDRDEEPIKAATSDALKRCAVLFGIGRHLYEDNKPGSRTPQRAAPPRSAPRPVTPPPDEDELAPEDVDALFANRTGPEKTNGHASGAGLTFKALAEMAEARGVAKNDIYRMADRLFGAKTKVTDLTGQQREQIAYELGLTA